MGGVIAAQRVSYVQCAMLVSVRNFHNFHLLMVYLVLLLHSGFFFLLVNNNHGIIIYVQPRNPSVRQCLCLSVKYKENSCDSWPRIMMSAGLMCERH